MEIKWEKEGVFVRRLNKFLGIVNIGKEVRVHIHDPGRLEKLLYEGNKVLINGAKNERRKTQWDLIAAKYKKKWTLTNSLFHSKIAERLIPKILKIRKLEGEIKYGKSRIDFLADNKILIEVKGCTLEENGIALFPDAPTARGRRHLTELMNAMSHGYEAAIFILIFVPADCFMPNIRIDKKFANLFYESISKGMKAYPIALGYDGKWIYYKKMLNLC